MTTRPGLDSLEQLLVQIPGWEWTESYGDKGCDIIWRVEVETPAERVVLVNASVAWRPGAKRKSFPPGTIRLRYPQWRDYWRRKDGSWLAVVEGRARDETRNRVDGDGRKLFGYRELGDEYLPPWLLELRLKRRRREETPTDDPL